MDATMVIVEQEMYWVAGFMLMLAIFSILYLIRQFNRTKRYIAARKAAISQNHTYQAVVRRNAKESFEAYCDQSAAEDFLDEILAGRCSA